ncbi:hypothetical protein [Hymenobacter lucidus]|uniref:Uncharacterized protein n=1 Tax=Hymenobacter lucidus TaxID=2880930 RepID=A0ABS8AXV7_9BACT|nr:hypothetical protein [Hymenobacter lucidus]MCB2410612.1 hypothetical protein [Hymenobacter lucidus]
MVSSAFSFIGLLAAGLLLAGGATAQPALPAGYKFDFGSGPAAPGYVAVAANAAYSPRGATASTSALRFRPWTGAAGTRYGATS